VPEIRQDLTTREWVTIATERAKRPHELASLPHRSGQASRSSCVFCPGNEKLVREGARWYQYSRQLLLPSSKVRGTQVQRAIIADGRIITDAHIKRSAIGIRSVIESGTTIRNSVLMGKAFNRQKPGNRSRTLHHLASDGAATLRAPLSTKTLGLGKES
jgi:NDP-sugar pyrophosphorylase family protein